jgi:hypothetical protein
MTLSGPFAILKGANKNQGANKMTEEKKPPRVGFRIMRGAQLSVAVGFLVQRDGQFWCYVNEEDTDKPPHDVDALRLDPSELQLDSEPDADPLVYRYRVTFHVS